MCCIDLTKDTPLLKECVASEEQQISVYNQTATADTVKIIGLLHMHVPRVDKMQTSLYTLIEWQRRDPSTYPYPRIRSMMRYRGSR
jgi:hypothetical protein